MVQGLLEFISNTYSLSHSQLGQGNLEYPTDLNHRVFGLWLISLEKAHRAMGRTCKLHRERTLVWLGFELETFLLWGRQCHSPSHPLQNITQIYILICLNRLFEGHMFSRWQQLYQPPFAKPLQTVLTSFWHSRKPDTYISHFLATVVSGWGWNGNMCSMIWSGSTLQTLCDAGNWAKPSGREFRHPEVIRQIMCVLRKNPWLWSEREKKLLSQRQWFWVVIQPSGRLK